MKEMIGAFPVASLCIFVAAPFELAWVCFTGSSKLHKATPVFLFYIAGFWVILFHRLATDGETASYCCIVLVLFYVLSEIVLLFISLSWDVWDSHKRRRK